MRYTILVLFFFALALLSEAQQLLPRVVLKNNYGKSIRTDTLAGQKSLVLVVVWRACCQEGYTLLDEINEHAAQWNAKASVGYCAISVDDSRSSLHVITETRTIGWNYELLLDTNQEFRRQMGINTMPFVMIVDKSGTIIWKKEGYADNLIEDIDSEIDKLLTK
jgi:peroxiredoxin